MSDNSASFMEVLLWGNQLSADGLNPVADDKFGQGLCAEQFGPTAVFQDHSALCRSRCEWSVAASAGLTTTPPAVLANRRIFARPPLVNQGFLLARGIS